jgi:predicted secreted protein
MKIPGFLSFVTACISVIFIACGAGRNNPADQGRIQNDTASFTGCQERISVEAGVVIEIKLAANRGTGFQWLLKDSSSLIREIKTDVLRYDSGKMEVTPGEVTYQVLLFRAVKSGTEQIQLDYKTTFDENVAGSCIINLTVK